MYREAAREGYVHVRLGPRLTVFMFLGWYSTTPAKQ